MVKTFISKSITQLSREDNVKRTELVKRAISTFDHRCGKKKNTYIRFNLRHVGCPVVGCTMCGKSKRSTKAKNREFNDIIMNI